MTALEFDTLFVTGIFYVYIFIGFVFFLMSLRVLYLELKQKNELLSISNPGKKIKVFEGSIFNRFLTVLHLMFLGSAIFIVVVFLWPINMHILVKYFEDY